MDEHNSEILGSAAARLAAAADALNEVLARIEASQEALHSKVDRIIAAIEENLANTQQASSESDNITEDAAGKLRQLQREHEELKAQAARLARKTFTPFTSGLLSKSGLEDVGNTIEAAKLDKALTSLSLEQRVAVKAELARAGMIA